MVFVIYITGNPKIGSLSCQEMTREFVLHIQGKEH